METAVASPASEVITCPLCEKPFEACSCKCPFCGQSAECECAIGTETATGGG